MWPYTNEEHSFLNKPAPPTGRGRAGDPRIPLSIPSGHRPAGELATRSLAMPADTNPAGDMFGGWIMSQMDAAGAIAASARADGRVVTAAIDAVSFLRPVKAGDVLCCYTAVERVGRTSIYLSVQAWALDQGRGERAKVAEAGFTFVALDEQGKPRPVDRAAFPARGQQTAPMSMAGLARHLLSTWTQYRLFEAALARYREMSSEQLARAGIAQDDIVSVAFAEAERAVLARQGGSPTRAAVTKSRPTLSWWSRIRPRPTGPATVWLME